MAKDDDHQSVCAAELTRRRTRMRHFGPAGQCQAPQRPVLDAVQAKDYMPTLTLTHCVKRTVQLDTNTVQHSRSTELDACVVLEANCSQGRGRIPKRRGLALTM